MRKSKNKAEKAHFAMRSIQRCGALLNNAEIVRQIQANKLKFIERQSNRITVWEYVFNDIPYKVVYDKDRKNVVTILELLTLPFNRN